MTDKYAVIGHPISHSKSPEIHKMFAEQTGQDISYEAIQVPTEHDEFAAAIMRLRKEYKGCNVTVPFKQRIPQLGIPGITLIPSEDVMYAKAANTLKFFDREIQIDNTDGIGLVRDLSQNLREELKGKRLLLIGAGGAASGVLWPLRQTGAIITITNRTVEKAIILAERFSISSCEYERLIEKEFDIIINATSAGLTDSTIPLPDSIFAPNALAYDMMYGRETRFMAFARAHGARVADGLGMLVEQAAEAFKIWRGQDLQLDTAAVIRALRQTV